MTKIIPDSTREKAPDAGAFRAESGMSLKNGQPIDGDEVLVEPADQLSAARTKD
jgi:hypothetical protein